MMFMSRLVFYASFFLLLRLCAAESERVGLTPAEMIIIISALCLYFVLGCFCHNYIMNRLGSLSYSLLHTTKRGLDASVLETFPTFRYTTAKTLRISGSGGDGDGGGKEEEEALECIVCLSEYEEDETLRLIPRCRHVFHHVCIAAWLRSQVTCPLCRANLVPKPESVC